MSWEHIRAKRRVGGRDELRLVIGSVEPQAARKIDKRFLFVERAKHLHRCLQCSQLAIGVKNIEFVVVLTECGASIGGAVVTRGLVESLAQPDDEFVHGIPYSRTVAGKILAHPYGATLERHDRHKHRGIHLLVDERRCGVEGPQLIRRLHRGHIEVQSQQAVVAIPSVPRLFGRDLQLRGGRGGGHNGSR